MFFLQSPPICFANFPKSKFFLVSLKKLANHSRYESKHILLAWMLWSFLLTTPYLQRSNQREKMKNTQNPTEPTDLEG